MLYRPCFKCLHILHKSKFRPSMFNKPNTQPATCSKCIKLRNYTVPLLNLRTMPQVRPVDLSSTGYLYVIIEHQSTHNKHPKWIKVGRTSDPDRRLREYNSSFPVDSLQYEFLSAKLYDLNNCEAKLIEHMSTQENIQVAKLEWFKGTKGYKTTATNVANIAIKFIHILEEIYYDE